MGLKTSQWIREGTGEKWVWDRLFLGYLSGIQNQITTVVHSCTHHYAMDILFPLCVGIRREVKIVVFRVAARVS